VANWLRQWGVRAAMVAAAGVLAVLGLLHAFVPLTTSTVTETTTTTTQRGSLAPSASTGAAATPTPSMTVQKTTTTSMTGSDSLELGLLGSSSLLALMAVFYNRLSKVTLPGGLGFELAATDARRLTDTVAEKIKTSIAAKSLTDPSGATGLLRAFSYTGGTQSDPDAAETLKTSAAQAGNAAVIAVQNAQDLLRLAGSPALLRARAAQLGITDTSDIAALSRGELTDMVMTALAGRALSSADIGT
jgi:hypothetical protein